MPVRFTTIYVKDCDDCLFRRPRAETCLAADRPLPFAEPATPPDWCPLRGGVAIKLGRTSEGQPADFHVWRVPGEKSTNLRTIPMGHTEHCQKCGLGRRAMPSRKLWLFEHPDGRWSTTRVPCTGKLKSDV